LLNSVQLSMNVENYQHCDQLYN